jgi:hypothetical protein
VEACELEHLLELSQAAGLHRRGHGRHRESVGARAE